MDINDALEVMRNLQRHILQGRSPDTHYIQAMTNVVIFLLQQVKLPAIDPSQCEEIKLEQCERQDTNSIFISNVHGDLYITLSEKTQKEEQ